MQLIYPIGCSGSLKYAVQALAARGFRLTDHPEPEVTHLLLEVPSFQSPGILKCGLQIDAVLETLPENITIIGGGLAGLPDTCSKFDLLRDEQFLARNADITARCAVVLAAGSTPRTLRGMPILVIGWGRIGKCLSRLLKAWDADVTVLARKPADRAILSALGYRVVSVQTLAEALDRYRMILNTAPETVIDAAASSRCRDCVKIDLASQPGILGGDVISARGLPGKMAPQAAGELIAQTIADRLEEEA